MGTALTSEQTEKLRRLAPRVVVVCYDGDAAGRAATSSALVLLFAQGFRARVARLPEGEDPHDVLRGAGTAELASRIEEAPDALDWLLESQQPTEARITSVEKQERIDAILEVLASIPDANQRQEDLRRLAYQVGALHDGLWQRVEVLRKDKARYRPGTPGNAPVLLTAGVPRAERRIIQLLVSATEHNSLILRTLKDEYLTHPLAQRIVAALRESRSEPETVDFQRQIAHLTQEERSFVSEIALEEQPEPSEKGVGVLLKDLEKKYLDRERAEIQQAIARAGLSEGEMETLLRRKQDISRRRAQLGR